ncbi:hypothetical protein MMYC01_207956 [Madurella mycetomatis]|uniref:Uncharacterized protein n=1 Tax=Madurella mycetomatis TaxID=100816 RepID=A0A175VVC0_9PEZI|nr:hypothetical protein MMYC01_207956 [Madurella mycetomatis]
MSKPPKPAALRYRKTPALIAAAYLAVLVAPWILTCVLSSRTIRQSRDNSGAIRPETAQTLHRVAFLIDVLNFIAALAALPVIYALLARAAVVFSQRTNRGKTLNVRQLFALADRQFLRRGLSGKFGGGTSLALLGAMLLLLTLVLPPIRAILVYTEAKLFPEAYSATRGSATFYANGWVGIRIGLDPPIHDVGAVPRRLAVEKTRHALINTFPDEWKATAWYDPDVRYDRDTGYSGRYFASSVARDTTTGMYRQHALRMNSSSLCDYIDPSEVPVPCPRGERRGSDILDRSYDNANLTVKVCVPATGDRYGSIWKQTENRQDLTETMYIDVSNTRSRRYGNYTLRCIAHTSMGYFELGNSFNGGRFGPLLSSFEFPTRSRDPGEFTDEERDAETPRSILPQEFIAGHDYGAEVYDISIRVPGPLAIAAHALFGAESFFDLAQSITGPNDTLSQTLCRLSPIPFQRVLAGLRRCEPLSTETSSSSLGRFASSYGWANDRVEALVWSIMQTDGHVDSLLNTAMYLANKATLDAAVGPGRYGFGIRDPNQIWRADGIEVRTPVVSYAALVVISVLLGLQVAGVLALVWYIYSAPTWTGTLDAMAVAAIARQLAEKDEGFLRADGLWDPTEEQLRKMESEDALLGAVEGPWREKPTDKTLSSGVSEEGVPADDAPAPGYVLAVGAPGLISRKLKSSSNSNSSA